MNYQVERSGTVAGLKTAVDHVLKSGPTCLFILSCDENGFLKKDLDPFLESLPVPVCGGVYPRLIVNNRTLEKGSIVIGGEVGISSMVIPDLCDDTIELDKAIDSYFPPSLDIQTVFIFVDGLANGIHRMIEALFNVFGLEVNYIGGGSGSLSLEKKPCLFSNQGFLSGGAVIAATTLKSGIGVSHGFRSIAGPFRITRANGTTIHSLNWEPAFEAYRKALESHTEKPFKKSEFTSNAVQFPFGIKKLGGEVLVRDPLKTLDNGSLVCAGELFEGDFVDILHGDDRSLIEAARKAAVESRDNLDKNVTNYMTIFMDCISRYLFLGNAFEEELTKVCSSGQQVLGACTLGEIANTGSKYLEFYNKTAVVAQIDIT